MKLRISETGHFFTLANSLAHKLIFDASSFIRLRYIDMASAPMLMLAFFA